MSDDCTIGRDLQVWLEANHIELLPSHDTRQFGRRADVHMAATAHFDNEAELRDRLMAALADIRDLAAVKIAELRRMGKGGGR